VRGSIKLPSFLHSRASQQRAADEARARAQRNAADLNDNIDPEDTDLELGRGQGPYDTMEVCLSEELALENLEKVERAVTEAYLKSQQKRPMSPFPWVPEWVPSAPAPSYQHRKSKFKGHLDE
jgi:hypothetical protein